jgi:hypothetical protein
MNTSENIRAIGVVVTETHLIVELEDGSRHAAPIALFPILADASPDERQDWEFIGAGTGIHWPEIDEDISVFSIVHPTRTVLSNGPGIDSVISRNRARRAGRSR